MTEPGDLYAVLGVAPSATPEQIRRAYRALMRRHHPDTRGEETGGGEAASGGGEALRRVLAAYAVLGDPQARAYYDRSRRVPTGQRVQVRRTRPRQRAGDQAQPAIRVGPVRWHPSSSR